MHAGRAFDGMHDELLHDIDIVIDGNRISAIGALEPGKLADIVLVEGDPLQDIGDTANVRTVIANGRVFAVDELLHPPVPGK